ncbi:MAG: hypothetical protein DME24_02335 [Verrucomicrobia bacterium]|nr:MAG: hypothetical protein DME24_02335 [Verrucomicrobiota bacterium]
MPMITYRSRFLTRIEVWFDDEPGDTRSADWILYNQRPSPVPGASCRYFYTYFIDLTQSREQLLAGLNEDTAYKIRRARDRDKVTCECCDPSDHAVIDRFEEMYNPFAALKGLLPLDRARIDGMASAGALDLSVVKDSQGNVLVYHANYRNQDRATELYLPSLYRKLSASAARNAIGRANRYLIWSDMLRYKAQGLKYFDFGGWYPGTADPALLKINEFKRGFGGQVVRAYQCEQILTLKGWLVLRVARLLKQTKLFPSGQGKPAADSPPPAVRHPVAAPSA